MVLSKGSRGADFSRYTFTWLQPRFELHVTKTVYSRNHWRKSLTRNSASAAVTQPELALVTTQHSFCLILNCPFLNPHVVSLLLFQFSPTLLVMEGGGGV